jgi:uncharacterized protein (TIGR03435 family)
MAIMPLAGGRFSATNVSLGILMAVAYDVRGFQISGPPGWAWSEKYDVVAKAKGNKAEGNKAESNPNRDEVRSMLQTLWPRGFISSCIARRKP